MKKRTIFKDFSVEKVFYVEGTKSLDAGSLDFIPDGINFVGRTNENNGIQGKIAEQNFKPNDANTITASVIGNYKYVKYQQEPYYCSQNINKLTPKFEHQITTNIAMYFVSNIQKFVSFYNGQQGGYKLSDLKNHKITLPVIEKKGFDEEYNIDDIDFDYMEGYIEQIKLKSNKKIDEFMKNNNLIKSKITKVDLDILNKECSFGSYKLDEIFEKIDTKKLKYKVGDLDGKHDKEYCLPALTAGIENQGLSCYVPKEGATVLKNVISVSANGANTGAMFYQPYDFTVLQDSYAIKFKYKEELPEEVYLYFITVMQKLIRGNYDWSKKAGWERIKNMSIDLPIKDNKNTIESLDFDYMKKYITVLKRKSINNIIDLRA